MNKRKFFAVLGGLLAIFAGVTMPFEAISTAHLIVMAIGACVFAGNIWPEAA